MEFGNIVAVALIIVAIAVVVNLILAYRRHRLATRLLTAEAQARADAVAAAVRADEARAADTIWEVNRAAIKKLMQDILQQSGKTDLRLHEERDNHTMRLIGRTLDAGSVPLVTVGIRDGQFYYVAHTGEAPDGGEIASPPLPTVDDLRLWLTDLWTYET